MSGPKKSRGRQKIEMKKMSNESNLQVTFSKRRSGLFKKASELCTLCGADVALVVFSPGEKVFSFGHPNVDAVIDRYLERAPPTESFMEAHRMAHVRDLNAQLTQISNHNVRELNAQLTQINNHLNNERKRAEELNLMKKGAQAQLWWARPLDGMSIAQLKQFKAALEELKKQVARLADRAMLQSVTNPTLQFFPGVSSSSNSNLVHQQHPLQPQVFPPHLIQPPMLQHFMFHDGSMMRHHGFNNMGMGGYGPAFDSC
ncbi:Agamous-like MADS-box protein AGL62 [Glycine soja]|uniref:Agamous-like MADS-box protein AGL62 n=1 Tax=Glycine soja TaxID=3848 RepID=A0A0B2P1N7_GLYSO|nr:Agamous-like MADS-box protein AGL62 [Glycine soja]